MTAGAFSSAICVNFGIIEGFVTSHRVHKCDELTITHGKFIHCSDFTSYLNHHYLPHN